MYLCPEWILLFLNGTKCCLSQSEIFFNLKKFHSVKSTVHGEGNLSTVCMDCVRPTKLVTVNSFCLDIVFLSKIINTVFCDICCPSMSSVILYQCDMTFNSPRVYTPPPCLHPASMGKWLEYSTSEPEIWVQISRGPDFRLNSQSFNYPEDIVGLLHFEANSNPAASRRHGKNAGYGPERLEFNSRQILFRCKICLSRTK